jgi:hypothetical protein
MPRLKGYRFRSLAVNGEVQTPDVIGPPERVDTNWRLADGHRLVLDDLQEVRGGLATTCSSVLALTGGCTPDPAVVQRRRTAALHLGGTGLVLISSPVVRTLPRAPWRLRTGHSARTRSRDQSPATTPRRVPGTRFREVPRAAGKDRPNERRHSTASEQGSAPAVSKQLSRSRSAQEDRVANVALGSASRHGVELDAVPHGHSCERECRNNDSGLSQSAQPVTT